RKPSTATASSAPAIVRLPAVEVRKQRFVQILDKHQRRVVTAIEILSPSNKEAGSDHEQYLIKREQYRAGRVNLVEIDLLRGGHRMPTDEPLPPAEYYALVCRVPNCDRAEVWPISLQNRLPQIAIPLDPKDADATLDLQAVFERTFEDGGWSWELYENEPDP